MLPQFTCSEKSRHQEILARALHLVCSSLKELSSCVLWVSCTLSRILYKLHNFFLWEECMDRKTGDQTFSFPWNMCFTELRTYLESWWWVIVKRFFFHYMGSWFICALYKWNLKFTMSADLCVFIMSGWFFFFISTGTYLLVKTVNQE